MAAAALAAGLLHASEAQQCLSMPAPAPSGSHCSTSSGWSSGTHAVEQPCSSGLQRTPCIPGSHSSPEAPAAATPAQPAPPQPWTEAAAPAAAAAGAAAAAAAAAAEQPWQLPAQCAAGPCEPPPDDPLLTGWQHGALAPPPPLGPAAGGAPGEDPWCCGLDMVVANSATEEEGGLLQLPLHLTDAGLDALLAPFEDWGGPPCLLPIPGPLAAPAPPAALQQPQLQPRPAAPPAAAAPACSGQQTASASAAAAEPAAAAAAVSPRSSSGGSATTTAAAAPTTSGGASDPGGSAGGKSAPLARRRGGRPRIHHPRTPSAAAAAAAPPAAQPPLKKSGRGPKPKYVFSTAEEAADARRERNRKAALESYYRKKEHTQRLQAAVAALQAENAALQGLLHDMASTGCRPLGEASDAGIDAWLRIHCPTAAAVAPPPPTPCDAQ